LLVLMHVDGEPPTWLAMVLLVSVWVAVISTIYSGVGYVFVAAKYFR
jgi:hypothetical protein